MELGLDVLACASTGNLANSVAAHAARLGMECCVFIPDNLEAGKVLGSAIFGPTILAIAGNYDDVNRLCTQVADRLGWGFVNINLRSYYAEGAKTLRLRDRRAARLAVSRSTSCRRSPAARCCRASRAGFRELRQIGLVDGELPRIHAAQAAGCAPVVNALESGAEHPEPVRPDTIAKSIAIGNPADGYQVLQTVRGTGGSGAAVTDARDRRRDSPARRNRRHLHRTGRRHHARRHDRLIKRGVDRAGRIGRRLRHRQRLQDRRSRRRSAGRAGPPQPRVQGIRSLVGGRTASRRRLAQARATLP